jgi:flagellar hook-associated protein 2
MGLQFSGLGSGLPINDWITQLMEVRRVSTVTPLQNKKSTLQSSNSALNAIKASVTELQAALRNLTADPLASSSSNIWEQNSTKSSDASFVSATATSQAFKGTTKVQIVSLASYTTAQSKLDLKEGTPANTNVLQSNLTGGTFVSKVRDEEGKVIEENSVKTGEVKINGQSFEITATTKLDDLLRNINSNKEANVTATYNTLTNTVTLTATKTGKGEIQLEDVGNTGLFDALGLMEKETTTEVWLPDEEVEGEGKWVVKQDIEEHKDLEEREVTKHILVGQKEGKDAEAIIDGERVTSSTNTFTAAQTGVLGLTINLNKMPDEKDASKTFEITTAPDNSAAKKAMEDFVSAYNRVMTQISDATGQGGSLEMDGSLRQLQTSLRSAMTAFNENDGKFSLLSNIGLNVGSSVVSINSTILQSDPAKITKAFDEELDSVQKLLAGGSGLFDNMLKRVNSALESTNGYFATKSNTLSGQIRQADANIEKANEALKNYQTTLVRQFSQMDKIISGLNQQYSALSSALVSLGANNNR